MLASGELTFVSPACSRAHWASPGDFGPLHRHLYVGTVVVQHGVEFHVVPSPGLDRALLEVGSRFIGEQS